MSFSDFDRGIKSTDIRALQRQQLANEHAAVLLERWHESERILNILRSIPPKRSKPTKEIMDIWRDRVKM